jgi:hypothetical protein
MPVKMTPALFEKAESFLYFGTLGAFAALVGYLHQVARRNGEAMSWLMLFVTAIVGFYMGMLFGQLVPADWGNRDAIVLLVGATGMKGFELVYTHSKRMIPALLQMVAGGKPGATDKSSDTDQ